MAPKKKPATKKAAKRSSKKAAGSATAKKAASTKTTSKKSTAAKPTTKKTTIKKTTTKKITTKKTTTKKPTAKKAASKKAAAPRATASKKTSSKKPVTKKAPAKTPAAAKKTTKKASAEGKAPASKKAADKKSTTPPASKQTASPADKGAAAKDGKTADGKPARKGITIVENRSRKKKAESKFKPPPSTLGTLLNKRRRQPLIPSGPNAPTSEFSKFGENSDAGAPGKKVKSPFKKKELDAFREILLRKRRELAGDVEEMERSMASLGDRGGNPALDVAEQGSDAYDQSLSIGLAEADRKLIREIDEAIRRIDEGVYGVCEVTHEPISTQRLNELPWTRLSIEAARDAERRGGGR